MDHREVDQERMDSNPSKTRAAPLIDRWMAEFDVSEYHERLVAASPKDAHAALRRVDLAASLLVRLLFAARGLLRPGRPRRYTLDGFVDAGFTLLDETPHEIVLGVTGRFWRPAGGLVRLTSQEFAAFNEPGWAQAVWNFRVGSAGDGTLVSTETRVSATNNSARRAFRRYWRVVGPFSALIRRHMLKLVASEAEHPRASRDL